MTTTTPNYLLCTITIAFSSPKKPIPTSPSPYGIDGVLDPFSATKCSVFSNPTAQIKLQIDRSLLDLAIRALKRMGFFVEATAMAIKSFDLMYFDDITVFAPSDVKLFSFPNGFRYDFCHHVVTKHLRFANIAKLPAEIEMETIDPEKMLVIGSINAAKIYSTEIYLNRWISLISISQTFDDESDNEVNRQIVYPGVPFMGPTYFTIGSEDSGIAVSSTTSSYSADLEESSTATGLLDPAIERMLDKLRKYPFYPSRVPHVTPTVKILDGIGKVGQKCTTAISLCLYESKMKLHGQKCN